MAKKRGFGGIVVQTGGESLSDLRRGIKRDIDRAIQSIDAEQEKKDNAQSEVIKSFNSLQAWNVLTGAKQNIANRLGRLNQYVEQSGPNAGRIVIPQTYDAKARQLIGESLELGFGTAVDAYNAFSAASGLLLWGFLANNLNLGGLGDTLFGAQMLLNFSGMGLTMNNFLQLPTMQPVNQVLLPRVVVAALAAVP